MPVEYECYYAKSFCKCLARRNDLKRRAEVVVDRILSDPYHPRSHLLEKKGRIDLRGKRSRHISGNFVIVYRVCEECIQEGFRDKGYNNCSHCTGEPLKAVIFLGFDKHDVIYARQWDS